MHHNKPNNHDHHRPSHNVMRRACCASLTPAYETLECLQASKQAINESIRNVFPSDTQTNRHWSTSFPL
ncbi:hypothetical protein EYC80_004009 [Monilinia laxa]|uniref:Uncharacterized protein n=1 Tax=Monilinia laxa TaxID=61186 RepID=A0A5N6KLS2_MONLA|nr:hypothetical protein EYC80_004009 [Monilinia laxa]